MNKRLLALIGIIVFCLYSVWYISTFITDNDSNSPELTSLPNVRTTQPGRVRDKVGEKIQNISVQPSLLPEENSTPVHLVPQKIKVLDKKKLSERHEEFFTIQVVSSRKLKDAERAFGALSAQLTLEENNFLRIEKIQQYYTLRLGKFQVMKDAKVLFEKIDNITPGACLLSAYVKPVRIIKMFSPIEIATKGSLPKNQSPAIEAIDTDNNDRKTEEVEGIPDKIVVKPLSQLSDKIRKKELPVALKTDGAVIPPGNEGRIRIDENITDKSQEMEGVTVSPQVMPRQKGIRDSVATKYSLEVVTVLDKNDQNGDLQMPSSLFYDKGTNELYVLNSNERRFVVYGADYFPQNSIGGGRGIYTPTAGAVDSTGRVYILQGSTKGVEAKLTILNKAYLIEKEYSLKVGKEELPFSPNRLSVSTENKIYIVGSNETRIMVLDENGVRQNWFQIKIDRGGNYLLNDKETNFDYAKIIDVTIDNSGNLYFTSERLGKIFVFNQQEEFLFSFGRKGGAKGKLSRPKGLAIDEKQRCIYVIDYMRHALVAYDFQGKFRFEHGGRGWDEGWFNFPVDVEVGQQGQVIVADYFNHRVQILKIKVLDILPGGDNGSPAEKTQGSKK